MIQIRKPRLSPLTTKHYKKARSNKGGLLKNGTLNFKYYGTKKRRIIEI